MGCSQSKPSDVNCARVAADRPGKSAVANNNNNNNSSATLPKKPDVQRKQENDAGSHPNNSKGSSNDEQQSGRSHHPSSSGSLSDALDLASLRKEMKSQGDIAKTVVRIEVRPRTAKVPSGCTLYAAKSLHVPHRLHLVHLSRKFMRESQRDLS